MKTCHMKNEDITFSDRYSNQSKIGLFQAVQLEDFM